jgi:AcrR family transcriptional regulator
MDNKTIQTQRMRGYFIEAAKAILKSEGLRGISVRNVADQAGYSYATLYNYFKDVKDLVFECVKDFQDECEESVRAETRDCPNGLERIRKAAKSYVKFFVQYPGIFELFFLERMADIAGQQPTAELTRTFFDRLCVDDWKDCVERKTLNSEQVNLIKDELNFTITGMLLFYINRGLPQSYTDFTALTDAQLRNILGRHALRSINT